ncbi:MAG: hypothetical protein BWY99_02105 [Synergistetes bacterium ADurb.BinA166]|nr:MAG: hypothetical protein BWY99_02105 [Synergistetes bacterium ADurb.BinA166]
MANARSLKYESSCWDRAELRASPSFHAVDTRPSLKLPTETSPSTARAAKDTARNDATNLNLKVFIRKPSPASRH